MSETNTGSEASELAPINSDLFRGVRVSLEARLGRTETTIEALMEIKPGSVLTLDCSLADPVDLFLNDALVAQGEIVAVGDRYGIRITRTATP